MLLKNFFSTQSVQGVELSDIKEDLDRAMKDGDRAKSLLSQSPHFFLMHSVCLPVCCGSFGFLLLVFHFWAFWVGFSIHGWIHSERDRTAHAQRLEACVTHSLRLQSKHIFC